jgi:hypothetical protein
MDFDIFAIFTNKGGVIMNRFRRRVPARALCWRHFTFQLTFHIGFLKEDYYV